MRQQMAEAASLLVSPSYEQPQQQLQHAQRKLEEHLADPSRPLNLEQVDAQGQAEGQGLSAARAHFNTAWDNAPRTPNMDAVAREARAKRVASSREVSAQATCQGMLPKGRPFSSCQ